MPRTAAAIGWEKSRRPRIHIQRAGHEFGRRSPMLPGPAVASGALNASPPAQLRHAESPLPHHTRALIWWGGPRLCVQCTTVAKPLQTGPLRNRTCSIFSRLALDAAARANTGRLAGRGARRPHCGGLLGLTPSSSVSTSTVARFICSEVRLSSANSRAASSLRPAC